MVNNYFIGGAPILPLEIYTRYFTLSFIGNKDSHDSSFNVSIGDCKAFWQDVEELEKLFYCEKCSKQISVKHYDKVNKKISCKCGGLEYEWNSN